MGVGENGIGRAGFFRADLRSKKDREWTETFVKAGGVARRG